MTCSRPSGLKAAVPGADNSRCTELFERPDSTRAYQATLTVLTDVNASFFGAGDTFEFPLVGSGVAGPSLSATTTPQSGELRFEWSAAGYILQRTSNLVDPASWTNVPAGETGPVRLNPGPGAEFFRLVKP